jgi:hypothetical protein
MSGVIISGDTSGSVTLSAPAVAGSSVLTLPAVSGTVITTGTTGQVIPKAALPTGSVLQVVQASVSVGSAYTTATPTSRVSLSITPSATSSKILLMYTAGDCYSSASTAILSSAFYKNAASILQFTSEIGRNGTVYTAISGQYLDSPATISAITYAVYHWNKNATGTTSVGDSAMPSVLTAMEISA